MESVVEKDIRPSLYEGNSSRGTGLVTTTKDRGDRIRSTKATITAPSSEGIFV